VFFKNIYFSYLTKNGNYGVVENRVPTHMIFFLDIYIHQRVSERSYYPYISFSHQPIPFSTSVLAASRDPWVPIQGSKEDVRWSSSSLLKSALVSFWPGLSCDDGVDVPRGQFNFH